MLSLAMQRNAASLELLKTVMVSVKEDAECTDDLRQRENAKKMASKKPNEGLKNLMMQDGMWL